MKPSLELVTQVCYQEGVVYEHLSVGMKAHWNRRVSYAVAQAGTNELAAVVEATRTIHLPIKHLNKP
jgi:hypothetical protein